MTFQRSPFQNAGIAIAKVLSMTAGSSDYDNTFRRDSSGGSDFEDELPFLPVTYILWIVFIILMPVLLNNLLVCHTSGICGADNSTRVEIFIVTLILGWSGNRRHKIC